MRHLPLSINTDGAWNRFEVARPQRCSPALQSLARWPALRRAYGHWPLGRMAPSCDAVEDQTFRAGTSAEEQLRESSSRPADPYVVGVGGIALASYRRSGSMHHLHRASCLAGMVDPEPLTVRCPRLSRNPPLLLRYSEGCPFHARTLARSACCWWPAPHACWRRVSAACQSYGRDAVRAAPKHRL
jgi:hypothetical protein